MSERKSQRLTSSARLCVAMSGFARRRIRDSGFGSGNYVIVTRSEPCPIGNQQGTTPPTGISDFPRENVNKNFRQENRCGSAVGGGAKEEKRAGVQTWSSQAKRSLIEEQIEDHSGPR